MTTRTLSDHRKLLSLALFAGFASAAVAQDQAVYEFEFIAEWSEATHPAAGFPNNPHFSRLTGATHNDQLSLWSPNAIATNGIEVMAESGGTNALRSEVLSHIDNGTADQFLLFGPTPLSPGSTSGTIEVDSNYSLLTLVTMIAPSPDWFVGIHDLDLREGGVWVQEITIDLDAYDSGTDAGVNYTSSNSNIAPHDPIANLSNEFPFIGTPRIGTLRITRISCAADIAPPFEGELNLQDVFAFLALFNAQDPSADLAVPFGAFNVQDIFAYLALYNTGC
ncbi:MAG: spondin domain-containing protein [Phycisphaerales bacterium]|nr:spondin domain-containing protein [Phycisphaerales bacterium]